MKTQLPLDKLIEESNTLSYWMDGANVEMSITQSGGIPIQVRNLHTIMAAIAEISYLVATANGLPKRGDLEKLIEWNPLHVMINRLPAMTAVPVHTDTVIGGRLQRWHLPIKTNDKAYWWDTENGIRQMPAGIWQGPMPYWIDHRVVNDGLEERIHLIVDLTGEDPATFKPHKTKER